CARADAAHSDNGSFSTQAFPQATYHRQRKFMHGWPRQTPGFVGMRQALYPAAIQGGVGRNHSVHSVAGQQLCNRIDLFGAEVWRNLHNQWHPLAMYVCQGFTTQLKALQQTPEIVAPLQAAEIRRVGGRDLHRDIVCGRIHAVEASEIVIHRIFYGRAGVLADIQPQYPAVLTKLAALDIRDKGIQAMVVEAEAVDQRLSAWQSE